MNQNSLECSFDFASDGELIVLYPEGIQDHTGIYPTESDRLAATAFAETTTGKSLLMRQRKMLMYDDRTGLLNERAGRQYIEKELERINDIEFTGSISVIFIDLDHFGAVNKEHSHAVGDLVLQWFSQLLKKRTRGSDIVIRWGGEEFVIFCTQGTVPVSRIHAAETRDRDDNLNTLADHGMHIANRIKRALEAAPASVAGAVINQRATFGVATMLVTPQDDVEGAYQKLFTQAERLVGKAKLTDTRGEIHVAETSIMS